MNFLEQYARKVMYSQERETITKITLFPLYLLSWFYQWALMVRLFLYRLGIFKREKLSCAVISIGNITVGGTGKTPLVQSLAQFLVEKGKKPVILSRGYKGRGKQRIQVLSGRGDTLPRWEETGDEPYLLAKKLMTVPVIVGKDRVYSGKYALRLFSPDVLLLDDGFQHFRLKRDIDIVVIDAQNGFGNGHVLPRGPLREPLRGLGRADLILLNKVTDSGDCYRLEREIRRRNATAPIFFSHYKAVGVSSLKEGEGYPPEFLKGRKVMALSGIANPRYFHFLLIQLGAEIVSELSFPDHHHYAPQDLIPIKEKSLGSELIITTEKDGVKLKEKTFENLPLFVLEVALQVTREEEFKEYLLQVVTQKGDTGR
jgi:tetraacyldisaccharide 4'-kinase